MYVVENGEVAAFQARAPLARRGYRDGQRRLQVDDFEVAFRGAYQVGVGMGVARIYLPHRQPRTGEGLGYLGEEPFGCLIVFDLLSRYIFGDQIRAVVDEIDAGDRCDQVLAELMAG